MILFVHFLTGKRGVQSLKKDRYKLHLGCVQKPGNHINCVAGGTPADLPMLNRNSFVIKDIVFVSLPY